MAPSVPPVFTVQAAAQRKQLKHAPSAPSDLIPELNLLQTVYLAAMEVQTMQQVQNNALFAVVAQTVIWVTLHVNVMVLLEPGRLLLTLACAKQDLKNLLSLPRPKPQLMILTAYPFLSPIVQQLLLLMNSTIACQRLGAVTTISATVLVGSSMKP